MFLQLCSLVLAQEPEASKPVVTGALDLEGRYYTSERILTDFPEETGIYNYGEVVSRANLMANTERWQLGMQLDQVSMFNSWYYLNDERVYEFDLLANELWSPWQMTYVAVEKAWAEARFGPVTVGVGDQYLSVGRGLALNAVKNTQIDLDTSIRGAKLSSSLGSWDVAFVSGVTNQQQVQQDNPNRQIRSTVYNLVNALRVDRYGLGPVNVGAHAVSYSFGRDPGKPLQGYESYSKVSSPDVLVGGADVEAFLGPLDLFFEADYFNYRSDVLFGTGGAEPGYAVYGAGSFYPGRFAVLVEGKRYRNTEKVNTLTIFEGYEIATGPSLEYERVITEDSSAAVNSNDVYGGRVQVDFMARPGSFIPYVALAVFRDLELGGLHFNRSPETILHPVVGMDLQGKHITLISNYGYRTDIRDRHGRDQLIHMDNTLAFPLPGVVHGDLTWDIYRFWWGENENQQTDFYTSTLAFAVHHPSGLSVIVYNDFTNDPLALTQAEGNVSENVYLAGEVQYKLNDRTQLKAFYGAYKAGIRCAGGQCRQLPGFDGARMSVTTSF